MSATLWDTFDKLLDEAENAFLDLRFQQALDKWREYTRITAKTEYDNIIKEIEQCWDDELFSGVASLYRLFQIFEELKQKFDQNKISRFTFKLYVKLLTKIYREKFRIKKSGRPSLEHGVFTYLSGDYEIATAELTQILQKKPDNVTGRIYLGHAFMALKDQKAAITALSYNLFLAADRLTEDDLYLSQFKMLLGKFRAQQKHHETAAWLLTFESWYRNWLIIKEDKAFYSVMRQKESSERIMQVKYYNFERVRHFVRCLYIADYARQNLRQEKGLIIEQEKYMEKLDPVLFEKFRKKRKSLK